MATEVVDLGHEDAGEYLRLYREYEWWADREHADVEHALAHTPLAVGLRENDELVAAARVLTDFVYYAKVYDVIVAEARRGDGLGKRLMRGIVDRPRLSEVDVIELRCREGLIPFYEACGFAEHDPTIEVDDREEALVKMNYDT
jgi:predicted GNAT family N-acyltransferase